MATKLFVEDVLAPNKKIVLSKTTKAIAYVVTQDIS